MFIYLKKFDEKYVTYKAKTSVYGIGGLVVYLNQSQGKSLCLELWRYDWKKLDYWTSYKT